MVWFRGLRENSINLWEKLCSEFTSHFNARRKRPKTMGDLNAIIQDKNETLREYVECFPRAGVEVSSTHVRLKCFIFESNLRDDGKIKEELGLRATKDRNDLLTRTQTYVNYVEKKLVEEALRSRQSNKASNDERRSNGDKTKGTRPQPRDYTTCAVKTNQGTLPP